MNIMSYSTLHINEEKKLKLIIIRETGIFEKKHLFTEVDFSLDNHYQNINNIKAIMKDKIIKVIKEKKNYKWEPYDIIKLQYLHNVTIIKSDNKRILFTNINEATVSDLLKIKIDNTNKSIFNLNGLCEYSILIDPDVCTYDNRHFITVKLYSENGNMYGQFSIETENSNPCINYMKDKIEEHLKNAKSRIVFPVNKKDIVIASKDAYQYSIK